MIRALVSGTLYDAPKAHTGKSGKPFTTGKLRADASDGAQIWCSLIAFGDVAERLALLKAGAAISVAGRGKLSTWTDKAGNPAAGLDLVVDELATLKGKPKPHDPAQAAQQPHTSHRTTRQPHTSHRTTRQPEPAGAGIPFDDLDDWQP